MTDETRKNYTLPRRRRLINDMPYTERPLQRLATMGAGALTTAELLALIVGSNDGLNIGDTLLALAEGDLIALRRMRPDQIGQVYGVGQKTAVAIVAAMELGKRCYTAVAKEAPCVRSPADAANLLMPILLDKQQEEMWLLVLDTRSKVLLMKPIYRGSLNTAVVRLGEIFRVAIEANGAAIIAAHNHPSGDPSPSPEDVRVTRELYQAGKLMDIDLLDHIVVGHHAFVSLKERGLGFD